MSVASAQMMTSFVKLLLEQAERPAKAREGIPEEAPRCEWNLEAEGAVRLPTEAALYCLNHDRFRPCIHKSGSMSASLRKRPKRCIATK